MAISATERPAGTTLPLPLMTQKELQLHFRISKWTADRWVSERGCPVIRLPGGGKRFDLAAVSDWLTAQPAAA